MDERLAALSAFGRDGGRRLADAWIDLVQASKAALVARLSDWALGGVMWVPRSFGRLESETKGGSMFVMKFLSVICSVRHLDSRTGPASIDVHSICRPQREHSGSSWTGGRQRPPADAGSRR